MKLFLQYLREHAAELGLLAVGAAVFALVFALCALPAGPALYAGAICFFLGLAVLGVRFDRWRRRHALLRSMTEEVTESVEHLPPPAGLTEADYQALLRSAHADKTALAEKMEARYRDTTEYFGLWAHQIKTPIAAMSLLLQGRETEEDRALQMELQRVEQYVEMAMCYLRLDSETTDYVLRICDLDKILRQAVKRYAAQFIRRRIRLVYDPVKTQALTDEKALSFIVEQVLSNALKYTRAGGAVSITLEAPATLCIADTGIGIAAEDLPRIFERGYTGLNGRTDKRASGIGLYLCRRMAERLGHSITARSEVGRGTEIRIRLDAERLRLE